MCVCVCFVFLASCKNVSKSVKFCVYSAKNCTEIQSVKLKQYNSKLQYLSAVAICDYFVNILNGVCAFINDFDSRYSGRSVEVWLCMESSRQTQL